MQNTSTAPKFNLNDRVSIRIFRPDAFVASLPPAMNGQTGTVERIGDLPNFNGYHLNDPTYLVRFDAPLEIPNDWNNGLEAFWFSGHDLEQVQELSDEIYCADQHCPRLVDKEGDLCEFCQYEQNELDYMQSDC